MKRAELETFVRAYVAHGMVERGTLEARLAETSLPDERLRAHIQALMAADFAQPA